MTDVEGVVETRSEGQKDGMTDTHTERRNISIAHLPHPFRLLLVTKRTGHVEHIFLFTKISCTA